METTPKFAELIDYILSKPLDSKKRKVVTVPKYLVSPIKEWFEKFGFHVTAKYGKYSAGVYIHGFDY